MFNRHKLGCPQKVLIGLTLTCLYPYFATNAQLKYFRRTNLSTLLLETVCYYKLVNKEHCINLIINLLPIIELEWFGNHGFLVVVNKLVEIELENRTLEQRCSATESSVETEISTNRNLRRQLTNLQRTMQDTEWRLQEQIADLNNCIHQEKTANTDLRTQVAALSSRLEQAGEHAHGDSNSSVGEGSPATTASVMSTPASWRDRGRFSAGSSRSDSSRFQSDKLLRIAEKLNISSNGESDDL